jgi:acyl carrier protein
MADDYETIKKTLKAFILEDFLPGEDPNALEDSTPLITGGVLDSIATIRLATFVDATYGIDLEAHELSADYIDTLSDMATLVHSKLKGSKLKG